VCVCVCVCMSGCLSQVQRHYAEFQHELAAAAAAAPVAGMSAATLVTGVPAQSKSRPSIDVLPPICICSRSVSCRLEQPSRSVGRSCSVRADCLLSGD